MIYQNNNKIPQSQNKRKIINKSQMSLIKNKKTIRNKIQRTLNMHIINKVMMYQKKKRKKIIKMKRNQPKRNGLKIKMQVKNVIILKNRITNQIKNKSIEKYNDHNFIPYFPNNAY